MSWLPLFVALAKLATEFLGWLRERALLVAGESKGRADSDAAHARLAAEQAERMREIAAVPPTRADIERRLNEGGG
jgi:hypothetical protein